MSRRWLVPAILLLAFTLPACGTRIQQRTVVAPQQVATLDPKSPYLKAHLGDGRVYILSGWAVDSAREAVSGSGQLLDAHRRVLATGAVTVPIDSVALFETNRVQSAPQLVGLSVVTGASLAVTAFCLADTKACFGSCPTFYTTDGDETLLQAEGFSQAVAPALEATDLDALYRAQPVAGEVELTMRNEALETHAVRYAHLRIAPRPAGGRILATGQGAFREATGLEAPSRCTGREGDCLALVRDLDGRERVSAADSFDLATRETIELDFPTTGPGEVGLVIGSRQTLLTTYLLYQTLAYLGDSAAPWLARLDRLSSAARRRAGGVHHALGGIEVWVARPSGGWIRAGSDQEVGPLATDIRLVPLPRFSDPTRIQLRLTRGLWRIDYVALARLGAPVEPIRLVPAEVRRNGLPDQRALRLLADTAEALVTLPGDEYTLRYRLPDSTRTYELFLESRGYYLEWMREEWQAQMDPRRARMMFARPRRALRELAPEYKAREPFVEAAFWGSRYAKH